MATSLNVKHLEQCCISPPPGSAPAASLPLTFFDIPWLLFSPSQPLFFYKLPYSTSHFTTTTIPILKHSLSLTLQQFHPLAGHLSIPPPPSTPYITYSHANSISFTLAESNSDFNRLSGDHPRRAAEFHSLVPQLPSTSINTFPLLSVQVTVFSDSGVSIGIAFRHVIGDWRTFNLFMKSWAFICKSLIGGEELDSNSIKSLPLYDRNVIKNPPNGLKATLLQQWRDLVAHDCMSTRPNRDVIGDLVRATFLVGPTDMKKIKRWIIARCKDRNQSQPLILSPYVLTCSFIWVCLVRTQLEGGETNPTYFGFNAGAITRLDYHVPVNYFGNCVGFGRAASTREELKGEDGIVVAATAIARTIKELDGDILGGAERWIYEWEVVLGSDFHVMVVGSPKVDLYEMDFGWGTPNKMEEISIDSMKAISLSESRELKGGIEVGVVLPKVEMDTFTSLFNDAFRVLQ